jgi:hypothetical protein
MSTNSRGLDPRNLQDLAKLAQTMGTAEPVGAEAPDDASTAEHDDWVRGSGVLDLKAISSVEAAASSVGAVVAESTKIDVPERFPGKRLDETKKRSLGTWIGPIGIGALVVGGGLWFSRDRVLTANTPALSDSPHAASIATTRSPALSPLPVAAATTTLDAPGIDPSQLPLAPSDSSHADLRPSTHPASAVETPTAVGVAAPKSDAPLSPTTSPTTAAPVTAPAIVAAAAPAPPAAAAPAKPTGLDALMKQAVGASSDPPAPDPVAEVPAAAAAVAPPPGPSPGSVPLRPSLGAVQSALRAAMPGARACLDSDGPVARASVTFRSDGGVQSVAVSGPKSSEACIVAALKGARVPAFSQETFVFAATVRPD